MNLYMEADVVEVHVVGDTTFVHHLEETAEEKNKKEGEGKKKRKGKEEEEKGKGKKEEGKEEEECKAEEEKFWDELNLDPIAIWEIGITTENLVIGQPPGPQ
jgi:type I restriction-modification system DNA methylase subunit